MARRVSPGNALTLALASLVLVLFLLPSSPSPPLPDHAFANAQADIDSAASKLPVQVPYLVASSSGKIAVMLVRAGDTVTEGQVIAHLATVTSSPHTQAPVSEPAVGEAPPLGLPYCDENNEAVKVFYLHPDRILRNGAPCLPSTRLLDDRNTAEETDYVNLALANPRAPSSISCEGSNLRVATAASANYFENLVNLVGSVHYWEPNISIVVYDMGFSPEQVQKIKQMRRVTLRRLPLERLPLYFADFHTYAFKPFLFLDALRTFPEPCVLWQDAGQEFRRRITPIRNAIQKKGFFMAKTGFQHPTDYTHPLHIGFFGLTQARYQQASAAMQRNPEYSGLWECAGGIIGVSRNAPFLVRVIMPWAACAFYRSCVSPEGTDRTNDRQDQTALNLILYYRRWKTGAIPGGKLYVNGVVVPMLPEQNYEMYGLESAKGKGMSLINSDPTVPPVNVPAVLFSRKKYPPYPYTGFVQYAAARA